MKPKLTIPAVKLPRIPLIQYRLPYVGWRIPMPHTEKRMGLVLGVSVTVTAVAIVLAVLFAIQGTGIRAPLWPEPGYYDVGAAYEKGLKAPKVGLAIKGNAQTLNLNFDGGPRVEYLRFSGASFGAPSGLTSAFLVTADTVQTGGVAAYLRCEEVIFNSVKAPTFELTDSTVFDMILGFSTADGKSVTITGTGAAAVGFGGSRGAMELTTRTSYDRVIIDVGSTNAECGILELTNVGMFGAGMNMGALQVGTWTITGDSQFGTGDGINTPDFVFGSGVQVKNLTDDMVEDDVNVR